MMTPSKMADFLPLDKMLLKRMKKNYNTRY